MNIKSLSILAAAGAITLIAAPALAAPNTSPLTMGPVSVSANVVADCKIIGTPAGDFNFGTIDLIKANGPASPTYTIKFKCNNGTGWNIYAADAANPTPALPFTSAMTDAANDSQPFTISGDASSAGTSGNSNTLQTSVLTGSLPSGADPHTGSYSDQVTVTLAFQ